MAKFSAVVVAALLAMPLPAVAGDLALGLWELTMESKVPANPGWAPPPFRLTQCLKNSDAKDPSTLISSIAAPGATGCTYSERSYAGSTFRFALQCSGAYGIRAFGSVMFERETFSGDFTAIANIGGQSTEMANRLSGRRVGGC